VLQVLQLRRMLQSTLRLGCSCGILKRSLKSRHLCRCFRFLSFSSFSVVRFDSKSKSITSKEEDKSSSSLGDKEEKEETSIALLLKASGNIFLRTVILPVKAGPRRRDELKSIVAALSVCRKSCASRCGAITNESVDDSLNTLLNLSGKDFNIPHTLRVGGCVR
jgi:hypothetical protein